LGFYSVLSRRAAAVAADVSAQKLAPSLAWVVPEWEASSNTTIYFEYRA
jgi:hypothetical protein